MTGAAVRRKPGDSLPRHRFGLPESRASGAGSHAQRRVSRWFVAVAAVCFGAVGIALLSQHLFGMQPCPWCVLQRLIYLSLAAIALVGSAWRRSLPRRLCAAAVFALSLAGVAAAAWQHFRAAASASCNLTWADRLMSGLQLDSALPAVFEPRASCADAAVALLGVSYDLWSLALFAALAAVGLLLLRWQRISRRR